MSNAMTQIQGATKTWRRPFETLRTSVKDLNEPREVSGPLPITTMRPRTSSTSNGSLLFDLDLSLNQLSCPLLSSMEDCIPAGTNNEVLRLIERSLSPSNDLEKRVMEKFTLLKPSCVSRNGIDLKLLCEKMESTEFIVNLIGNEKRKCGISGTEFATVGYSPFLLIFEQDKENKEWFSQDSSCCILDPYFKSQFEIQYPSRSYYNIMELVPDAFVGTLSRLEELVKLLCHEMQRSFQEAGLPLPPWRVYKAIMSKWTLPCQAKQRQEEYFYNAVHMDITKIGEG